MNNKEIEGLLSSGNEQLDKFHKIVEETIKAEKLTKGQMVSDKVAQFGGSWKFIIAFMVVLSAWILFNAVSLHFRFDPYPFILMNLILSCIAALQAPIIMMSQNRQAEKDRMRSENDYLINLKAEMEIRSLNQKIDLLLEGQIKTLFEIQDKQFSLLKEINDKLDAEKSK